MARGQSRVCVTIGGAFDDRYGGGQVYVRHLVNNLRDRGHEVVVLEGIYSHSREPGGRPKSAVLTRDAGIEFVRVFLPLETGLGARSKAEAILRHALSAAKPDVVHANGLKNLSVRVSHELRIPCVVTAHHGGLVCPAGALLDYRDRICARRLELATCTHCCARQLRFSLVRIALTTLLPASLQLAIGRLVRRMPFVPYVTPVLRTRSDVEDKKAEMDEILAKATAIVAPSTAIRDALLRNGADPERTVLIPHGVPISRKTKFLPRANRERVRFLYVGRLSRVKGLHVLIEAFNRIRGPAELHIVGRAANQSENKYWASVVKNISRREAVIEHGHLTGDPLYEVMSACDVLVLPSISLEAFGLTVAEALACGKPVIATAAGGPAEQVSNGRTGIIIEPNNVEALAAAMHELVEDPQRIERLAQNILPPRSLAHHVDAIVDLYSRCINSRQTAVRAR